MTPNELVKKYLMADNPPDMFKHLDSIDWSALHHAYGKATDVPALLRAAMSQNEDDRNFAFQLLHQHICHQGTVYEASVHTVPFLFEMLQSSTTPDKPSVAVLLAILADGHPKNEHPTKVTKDAIGERLDLLYPYLQDSSLCEIIAFGLANYPEKAIEIIPILRKTLEVQTDKDVIETIQKCISKLEVQYRR